MSDTQFYTLIHVGFQSNEGQTIPSREKILLACNAIVDELAKNIPATTKFLDEPQLLINSEEAGSWYVEQEFSCENLKEAKKISVEMAAKIEALGDQDPNWKCDTWARVMVNAS